LASDAGERFCDVGRDSATGSFHRAQNLFDMGGVFFAEVGLTAAIATAIIVGNGRNVYPRFLPLSTGAIELVRANVYERGGVAVIGVFEDDNVFAIGVSTSQAKGEFIGFAAGVEEVADLQW